MPSRARRGHDVEHLVDHLGIQGRGRLVEQHDLRLHGQGPRDGHPLLLPAREVGGMMPGLLGNAHALQEGAGRLLGLRAAHAPHLHGREHDVLQDRHVGKQVEGLEHHAHVRAEPYQINPRAGDRFPQDDDLATLDALQPVDAADERALARARGPAHHHDLLRSRR